MCKKIIGKSIAQILIEKSAGMPDAEKSAYASEVDQVVFDILLKVAVTPVELPGSTWQAVAQAKYPSLASAELPDTTFYTCTESELQSILSRDWTNLVKYLAELRDCDDFAHLLQARLEFYYGITSVLEVWGQTTQGYHAFNLAVLKEGTGWVAKLIEPQSDNIFDSVGPLGTYSPEKTK